MTETLLESRDLEGEATEEQNEQLATRALTLVKLEADHERDDGNHIFRGLE